MNKKTITLAALVFAALGLLTSLLTVSGVFQPNITLGWFNEYGESSVTSLSTTRVCLQAIQWIPYVVFVSLFLWNIKKQTFAWLGNLAFAAWILWLVVDGICLSSYLYSVICFSGDEMYRPYEYWINEGSAEHPLVWLVMEHRMVLQNCLMATGVLAHLLFVPAFVTELKQNKAVGIIGIVTMIAYLTTIPNIPYLGFVYNICWIALLATACKARD